MCSLGFLALDLSLTKINSILWGCGIKVDITFHWWYYIFNAQKAYLTPKKYFSYTILYLEFIRINLSKIHNLFHIYCISHIFNSIDFFVFVALYMVSFVIFHYIYLKNNLMVGYIDLKNNLMAACGSWQTKFKKQTQEYPHRELWTGLYWNQNILRWLGQYRSCWWPGSLHHQVIINQE